MSSSLASSRNPAAHLLHLPPPAATAADAAATQLIASGLPARSATRSTAGCHIHVKLVDNTAAGASAAGPGSPAGQQQQQDSSSHRTGSLPAQRKFFVELWDVSGQPKYSQLRSVFFKQLNGVILVYDVTNKASLSRLQKWAAEVAHEGTFVAPLADELAARNVGGLPVPVLVVGNKSDRHGFSSHMGHGQAAALNLSGFLNRACARALLGPQACSSWWPRQLIHRVTGWGAGAGPRRPPSESSMAAAAAEAGLEPHLLGLTTSAAAGDIDWERLNGFFRSLWERRYQPATAGGVGGIVSGWGVMSPVGGFTGHPSLVLGVPAGAASACVSIAAAGGGGGAGKGEGQGDRLEDSDWV